MKSFIINKKKQLFFIKISNDRNPIHDIRKNKSKLNLEGTIVHGMHVVIESLEILSKKNNVNLKKIKYLEGTFKNPVFLNDKCYLSYKKVNTFKSLLIIKVENLEAIEIIIFFKDEENSKLNKIKKIGNGLKKPLLNNIKKKIKKNIFFNHNSSNIIIKKKFPSLYKNLGYSRLSSIIMMSTAVGMYWPGENSLFSSFKINFTNINKDKIKLGIIKTDKRFLYSKSKLVSSGIEALMFSFFRSENIKQKKIGFIKKYIKKDKFKNHRALIIGGSRGLGEITAKIIASGGGYPTITYNSNKKIALKLKSEIFSSNFKCRLIKLSINKNGNFKSNVLKKFNYNSIYYFATPLIFRRKNNNFNYKIYKEFFNTYCTPLKKIVLLNKTNKPFTFFFPSTEFILKKNIFLKEYIKAKSLGEKELLNLSKKYKFTPIIKRFPKILTDQNNTVFSNVTHSGYKSILSVIKEVDNKISYFKN